ncbi:MAG: NAD(P)-dependent alcohol dehydrogenase, partial [Gaiellaceae bacterium]
NLVERDAPTPRPNQVRVRIHATTVTTAEAKMRRGEPLWGRSVIGFSKPRKRYQTLGTELAGVVDAVGREVKRFREGDEVFGFAGWNIGANADYLCLPEGAALSSKPGNASFGEAAAAVDGATTALHFLRDRANLRAGQRVLIIGASGSIGTYAVQLAKRFGAQVTGVCGASNVPLVRSLGADEVIDYRNEDFREASDRWDVVLDTVGASSFAESKTVLAERGIFLPTVISIGSIFQGLWTPLARGKRLVGGMSMNKTEPLQFVTELIEDDALRIVIDRRFPLERIQEAHRLVDTGHKRGNVVIDVA